MDRTPEPYSDHQGPTKKNTLPADFAGLGSFFQALLRSLAEAWQQRVQATRSPDLPLWKLATNTKPGAFHARPLSSL